MGRANLPSLILRLTALWRAMRSPTQSPDGMSALALVSLVVRDYDEAIAFYTGKLGFALAEDTQLEPNKRWVV
ncbi:MAG: VOC family protein, partial [Rhizobiaceae bacterium]